MHERDALGGGGGGPEGGLGGGGLRTHSLIANRCTSQLTHNL